MKRGLSIRYKILILLTVLPLVALATYLALAINIFEKDKIAYVYGTSASVSKTVSAQVRAELSALIRLSQPIVSGYDFEKNNVTTFSKQLFENERSISSLVFYRFEKGKVEEKVVLRKKKDPFAKSTAGTIAKLRRNKKIVDRELVQARKEEVRIINGLTDGDRMAVAFRVGKVGDDNMLVVLAIINAQNIVPVFQSAGATRIYLADRQGQVFLGPDRKIRKLSELIDAQYVKDLKQKKLLEGADEVLASNGEATLMSYSPVGLGGLMTAALIEKGSALKAVDKLIQQSVLFFVSLFSATVIISIFASRTLTSALSSLYQGTRRVAEGHFDIKIAVKSSDEIGSLASSFNTMAGEVKRLMMETAEKARMEGELQTAQTVQETLFPEKNAKIERIAISGHYQPASECGGDWWHYCRIGKKVFVWIGDATGHGAPAALITSAAKSAATIIESLEVSPGKALELLNRSIYDVSKGKLMMTFFIGAFDLETGEFVYSNASHDPPLLFDKIDGPLKKKHLTPLMEANNPRLGQARETTYQEHSIKFDPGASLFLYTDGIPELYNNEGEMWSERNFLKAVLKSNEDFPSPEVAVERMVEKIHEFQGDAALRDDVTFFQLHFSEASP